MRNLSQYPITQEEKIRAVDHALQRMLADPDPEIGGTDASALALILKELRSGEVAK